MKTLSIIFSLFLCGLSQNSNAQKFHDQKIVGYVACWADGSQLDYSNVTHAIYAFVFINPDGSLKPMDSWSQGIFNTFLAKTKSAGVKRLVSIPNDLGEVSKSSEALKNFSDTIIKFCKYYEFDGLDIDWETLSSVEESNRYVQTMDSLNKYLHAENLLLVGTLPANSYWGQWYKDEALAKFDWMQIMVYDQLGTWSSSPMGNHSSFQQMVDAGNYWVGRGYAKNNLVMGLPFYGRKFSSPSGGLTSVIIYKDILASFPSLCDSMNQTPGTDYTFFNGPELVRKKCHYLIDNDFGGIMIWELTQDVVGQKSLLKQISAVYSDSEYYVNVCKTTGIATASENDFTMNLSEDRSHLVMNLNATGSGEICIYDLAGRLLQSADIYINTGSNSYLLINEVKGLFVCQLILNDKSYVKRMYK